MAQNKTLPLRVLTMNMKTEEITDDRVIDHNSKKDREWLGRHCFWAFRNNHGVQTSPE